MSKQKEIVVFREVKVGEYVLRFWPSDNGWMCGITSEMMQALTEQSAQQALDKKAENARELGLDYEPAQQEPVAWVPYLSDRADGVKGHYAIARWNPRGYREVWNLRRHEWGAYSDDVLSLEEADTLLRLITIPTRKVTSPQPAQQEPVAWMSPHGGMLTANYINNFASGLDKEIHNIPLCISPPAQRKPLTLGQKQRLWSSVGDKPTLKDRVNAYGLAIEAAHGIKEQK